MRRGVVVTVLLLATATFGLGQDNASTEVSAERQEIELLKKKIEELDQRLRIAERKNELKAEDDAAKAKAGVSLDAVAKKQDLLENRVKSLGPFFFSGDLRLRHESLFGSGPVNGAEPATRNRERYRVRFNINAKLNDEISGGFSLASGDLGDPISTNNTETGFFTRKPFSIDKAYASYRPKYFKPFSVTAGKFGYTWYRTELTFDNDINVEGSSQQISWDWKDKPFSHFAVIGFELPLLEVSGGSDSAIFGEQVQTGWNLGPRVKAVADVAYYEHVGWGHHQQRHTHEHDAA